jgi:sporulation protein YlmC with PRC-barrel domain
MRKCMITLASVGLLCAMPAFAQQQAPSENPVDQSPPPASEDPAAQSPPPASEEPAQPQNEKSSAAQETIPLAQSKPAQQQPLVSTQSIVGATVKNTQGDELGKIQELMVDPQSGRVQYAVLSAGGVLGMGGERYSIPWEAMKMGLGKDELVVELDKEQLQQASGASSATSQ